ncbi:CHRD domain-containing protein [Rubrolithibacter danxiaensis]|uniref:CHRD domain-containing protein n=1 Tax=Rubrolithibacter danxiaensis TaxID=3390805 RepID=UPI003BF8C058
MKTLIKNQLNALLFILGVLVFAMSACKKDKKEDANPLKTATIQLSGANEVPAVTDGGSGTIEVAFDPISRVISYNLSWQLGASSSTTTGMHFHGAENGSPSTSSPVEIPVTGFSAGNSGTLSGSTDPLTQEQANELLAGKWYFNVHSSAHPSGEIRGNIIF